ncbi:MAG: extensin-like domain-containing protein [Xanthobacteraceae bacterium]
MKLLSALILPVALCALVLFDLAAAQAIPLPRPRPDQAPSAHPPPAQPPEASEPEEPPPPSACRLRLTAELAVAPSLPAVVGRGECGVADGVRLEAVWLRDKTRVALTPPAIVRCTFAEAIVQWVREDVAPAVRALGGPLKSLDNYAAYDCRGRNRVAGAKLSEHGKANALDVRSVKLANGTLLGLTDPQVAKDFRLGLRKSTCARFTTVLGPGSDGYHEDHVHVDLAERAGGHRLCHWEVREPGEEPPAPVPLPVPRPASANHDGND